MQGNLSLDRTILAYALHNKSFAMELSNAITFEYFHTKIQWLYTAIMDHFTNPKFKELPTANIIEEYLKKNYSQKEFIDKGLELFKEIQELEIEPAEFTWHLEKLKGRFNDQVQRSCAQSMVKLIKDGGDNDEARVEKINEILKDTIVTIDKIHKREAYDEGSLDQSAVNRAKHYKEVEANPELARGILTGFTEFDRMSNGLHPGELLIVGGATGTGKSIMMHNMAVNAYLGAHSPLNDAPDPEDIIDGHNILYFSLEMPKSSQERRIDACMAGIIANEIRDGRLSPEDKEKYFKVLKFQKNYAKKFHIVDMARGVTTREIELKYNEKCDEYGIKFDQVWIDYLGLMKPSIDQKSDWLELGYTAQEVHEFGRSHKISVGTGVQLNRPKDPNKPQHSTDRIARSNMIPDNANVIFQIACRGDDEHTRLDMPVYITKMRDGEKGSFTLTKDFSRMKVVDLVDATFSDDDEDDDEL